MDYKKIRIDYYNYRFRKGRGEILLQTVDGSKLFCIPYHYISSKEHFPWGKDGYRSEDDGDLVLIKELVNVSHAKSDRIWVPVDKISELSIIRNEDLHVSHNIVSFFLSHCPEVGYYGVRRRALDLLETIKIDIAKKEYVKMLRRVLENNCSIMYDFCYMTKPDPELIRKEIETLEHFRLYKPHPDRPSMNQREYELDRRDLYSFDFIGWEAFGAKKLPSPFSSGDKRAEQTKEKNEESA